jgi:hypothetical protein
MKGEKTGSKKGLVALGLAKREPAASVFDIKEIAALRSESVRVREMLEPIFPEAEEAMPEPPLPGNVSTLSGLPRPMRRN